MTINEFAALQDFINDNTEQGSYDGGFSYMSCLHCEREFKGFDKMDDVLAHLAEHDIRP